jgi:hypothetical protein
MSPAMVKAQRRGSVEASIRYLFPRRLSALRGKLLTVPGRAEAHPGYPDVLVGEMSGILALSAPAVVSHFWQAVSLDTLLIDNWERKLDAIVEASVALDVRALAMAPTWAVVLFDKLLAAFRRRHGRAATSVLEVWPNLQVFFSGGVSLESYRQLLNDRIGDGRSVDFLEFYGASEGLFGTQSAPGETDMLLNLKADVFYEFVRMDELESSDPTRFTVADVELDVRYALFATTCSGLWSYGMRDVVRFTSLFPHRIVVAGRTTEMLDKYGEALFGDEVRAGLEFACRKTGALVSEYHVSPRSAGVGGMPALEWLIEFEKVPEDLAAFARSVDTHIQSVNRHYQIRREARALEGPELCVVPRGSFYRWLKATRASVGAQTKILRMSADRSISDGVIKVAGEREDAMRFPMGA